MLAPDPAPFDTFACDLCDRVLPVVERHAVVKSRPSNGQLCEVMWTCPECAPRVGAAPPLDPSTFLQ